MAKKKIQEKPKTLCADCARLKINESNRNWEGKAFTVSIAMLTVS